MRVATRRNLVACACALVASVALLASCSPALEPTRAGSALVRGLGDGATSVGDANLAAARSALLSGAGPGLAPLTASPSASPSSAYRWNEAPQAALGTGPSARYFPAMAWDAADGYVLLFGGSSASGWLSDTWTYVNGTWTNVTSELASHPPSLEEASMAFDPSTQSVVLFGGLNSKGVAWNFTWAYHDLVWTNVSSTAGPAPPARSDAGMSTDSSADEVVLEGGDSATEGAYANDTWTFKGGVWTNVTSTAPIHLRIDEPILSDDPSEEGAVLVGIANYSLAGPYGDQWHSVTLVFIAGVWENVTGTSGPGPMVVDAYDEVIGYLPGIASVVVYADAVIGPDGGGYLGYYTWEFAGGAWANVTRSTSALSVVLQAGGAAVPTDNTLVVFGGEWLLGYLNATWIFSSPPIVTAAASRTTVDAGMSVTFTGSCAYGAGPNVASWNLGNSATATGLTATTTYSAAGTFVANLTVTDLVGAAGVASVPIRVHSDPSASIVIGSPSPETGESIAFTAIAAGGTGPLQYAWTLGDGTNSSTSTFDHSFGSAGTYSVALTVTDALGVVAHASTTIDVAAAPTPFSLSSGPGLYLLLGLVALAAIAVVLGVLLARKGRGGRAPPVAYAPPPSSAPPTVPSSSAAPPPAPTPPPPWSEGPPPGAR